MQKKLIVFFISIIFVSGFFYTTAYSETIKPMMSNQKMGSMMDMCQSMMNNAPKDVIMRPTSSQIVTAGTESEITLLVLDKKTNMPLDNAEVILHIEKGSSMESMENTNMMDMMQRMTKAENIGNGKYLITFTTEDKGHYTIHAHAIPSGKSMMSMMNNHMDIGIIAK